MIKSWRTWPIQKLESSDFPEQLKIIKNCPKSLYYRGNYNKNIFDNSISIVGSRNITRYGKEIVSKMVPDLLLNKLCIISGFMYGVDCEVHNKCVENNGITVAVLGGGLDYLSPIENDSLYTEILNNNGLVVSEYEPDFKPTLWSFPQRNRIVSGLSTVGVLVVEAGIKSGSLITARVGDEQKKKIFAVPGPINSKTSEGTNYLIKNNLAKLVTCVEDILERPVLNYKQENIFINNLSGLELEIFNLLHQDSLTIDELSLTLNLSVNEISSTISLMSLKGITEEELGKIYLIN